MRPRRTTTALLVTTGTGKNEGLTQVATFFSDGDYRVSRPRPNAEVRLPAWTRTARKIDHGPTCSEFGTTIEYIRE